MEHLLENPEVNKNWEWLGEQRDVETLLADCDALLHVSLYEGLPNVVCESLLRVAQSFCRRSVIILFWWGK